MARPGAGAAQAHVAASASRIPAVRTPRRCCAMSSPIRSIGAQIMVEAEMESKLPALPIFSRVTRFTGTAQWSPDPEPPSFDLREPRP